MQTNFYYPSCGKGMIHGLRWEPEGKPCAVLQIVHGIAEHAGRYDEFAVFMAQQGFLVVAQDHMGHGGSIGSESVLGYFDGGWLKAVADTHRLMSYTKMEQPDIPYFMLGHAMGSYLVRTLLIKYPKAELDGVILSGTGWLHRGVLNTGIATASVLCRTEGETSTSKMLNGMLFGNYNRKVEHKRTDFDWLTRDNQMVDAYLADPLCGFSATVGLIRDMLLAMRFNQEPENLRRMRKDLPLLLVSGNDDPVGGYGEGVKKTKQALLKAGMRSVDMRLFPLCRHEILNEINSDEIYHYLLGWLRQQNEQ